MRQAILESADLGYVNGHANSLQCFLILKGDFWGVRGWEKWAGLSGEGRPLGIAFKEPHPGSTWTSRAR